MTRKEILKFVEKNPVFSLATIDGAKPRVRIAADAADQVGELPANDLTADDFVVESVVGQEVLIKEMPERTVAHVVEQSGHAHEGFDITSAGQVGADFPEARVEPLDRLSGQVHRPEDVLEPGVLRRRVDPPGGLQLVDLPEPLDPGMVDDLLLCYLAFRNPRRSGEPDVPVNRVMTQVLMSKVLHNRALCRPRRAESINPDRTGDSFRPI